MPNIEMCIIHQNYINSNKMKMKMKMKKKKYLVVEVVRSRRTEEIWECCCCCWLDGCLCCCCTFLGVFAWQCAFAEMCAVRVVWLMCSIGCCCGCFIYFGVFLLLLWLFLFLFNVLCFMFIILINVYTLWLACVIRKHTYRFKDDGDKRRIIERYFFPLPLLIHSLNVLLRAIPLI